MPRIVLSDIETSFPIFPFWPGWLEADQEVVEETISLSSITVSGDLQVTEQMTAANWAAFHALLEEWHAERQPAGSVLQMVMCPAYQRIMAMGDHAIPLILSRLRSEGDEPDHWFWALRALTNVDPVPEDAHGDIRAMAEAWLRWGEAEGYGW